MNSLNALGNRQIASLQADLAKMENGESGPSVQGGFRSGFSSWWAPSSGLSKMNNMAQKADPGGTGGITTTLGALSRLIDDYDSMARKEMVTAAREKANTWVDSIFLRVALGYSGERGDRS